MRKKLILTLLSLSTATPVLAQNASDVFDISTLPAPRATALELAAILKPASKFVKLQDDVPYSTLERDVVSDLGRTIYNGQSCDQKIPQCLAVAKDIAKKIITSDMELQKSLIKTIEYSFASIIQSRITDNEIFSIIKFLKTSNGIKLISLIDNDKNITYSLALEYIKKTAQQNINSPKLKFFEEYLDRTRGLPRTTISAPPPPPAPPAPERKK